MSFLQRAATFAAMTLGIASLVGASAPGFAFQGNHVINAGDTGIVPAVEQITDTASKLPAAQPAVIESDDEERYDSLSAAVADQEAPADMDRDLTCLAGAIYFESKGEPLSGQLAVAEVIINRAKSGRFDSSICGVVKQRGQFSFVRGGQIPAIANNRNYRTAVAVAQVAMGDDWQSPAPDALYFHARRVSPGWRMQKIASIGNHVFYR
jgi:N-acetylmuramoyl-L-alanine amidase